MSDFKESFFIKDSNSAIPIAIWVVARMKLVAREYIYRDVYRDHFSVFIIRIDVQPTKQPFTGLVTSAIKF